jgi:hypothetical protein
MEPRTGLHSKVRLIALPSNISLNWKRLTVANTLVYYCTELSFMIQDPLACTISILQLSYDDQHE